MLKGSKKYDLNFKDIPRQNRGIFFIISIRLVSTWNDRVQPGTTGSVLGRMVLNWGLRFRTGVCGSNRRLV